MNRKLSVVRGQVVSDVDESPLVGAVVQVVGTSNFMTKTKLNGWLVQNIKLSIKAWFEIA